MKRNQAELPVLLIILVFLLLPDHASAYVDPGAGYLLWQYIAAALVGCVLFLGKLPSRLFKKSQDELTATQTPLVAAEEKPEQDSQAA